MQHSTSKKTYTVIIEQDDDGLFVAKVPDIVGCHTQGKTVAEVMSRIKEAIQACSKDEDIEPLKFIGIQQVQME
jgi:predicted RNase H-like HicB family nuclease